MYILYPAIMAAVIVICGPFGQDTELNREYPPVHTRSPIAQQIDAWQAAQNYRGDTILAHTRSPVASSLAIWHAEQQEATATCCIIEMETLETENVAYPGPPKTKAVPLQGNRPLSIPELYLCLGWKLIHDPVYHWSRKTDRLTLDTDCNIKGKGTRWLQDYWQPYWADSAWIMAQLEETEGSASSR